MVTKGQFSATADRGSKSKKGAANADAPIDLAAVAIELGATFVARSFSGDREQLIPLLMAVLEHGGSAFLDVISPCVTFNNHAGSTKSFDYVREHNHALNTLDFITGQQPIEVNYAEGELADVPRCMTAPRTLAGKLDATHDFSSRGGAFAAIDRHRREGEIATGLLYVDAEPADLHKRLGTATRAAQSNIQR